MELERELESVTTTTVDNDINYCYTAQKIELSDESIAKLANALVKHGYWRKVNDCEPFAWDCSVCGAMCHYNTPYCPICGAKMDEVEEDE